MKKKKEEILRTKELPTEQGKEQSTEKGKEQSVQSNDTYIYGVGILVVLGIGACVFFAYNTFHKKQAIGRLAAQHE